MRLNSVTASATARRKRSGSKQVELELGPREPLCKRPLQLTSHTKTYLRERYSAHRDRQTIFLLYRPKLERGRRQNKHFLRARLCDGARLAHWLAKRLQAWLFHNLVRVWLVCLFTCLGFIVFIGFVAQICRSFSPLAQLTNALPPARSFTCPFALGFCVRVWYL